MATSLFSTTSETFFSEWTHEVSSKREIMIANVLVIDERNLEAKVKIKGLHLPDVKEKSKI